MLKLTEADVGKIVITGTPIDPQMVWEEYPEQKGKVLKINNIEHYDDEPGDADWAEIQVLPESNYDMEKWFANRELVLLPPDAPCPIISTPWVCVLRYA